MPPPKPSRVRAAPTTMPSASVGTSTETGSALVCTTAPSCPPDSHTTIHGSNVTRKITRDICTTATRAASAPSPIDTETM